MTMSDRPNEDTGDQFRGPDPAPAERPGPEQLGTLWRALVEDLPPNQRAWLAGSRPVTLHEGAAIIAVGDDFTRNQLEGRLRTRLEDALGAAFHREVRIAVTVDAELGRDLSGLDPHGRDLSGREPRTGRPDTDAPDAFGGDRTSAARDDRDDRGGRYPDFPGYSEYG